MMHFFELAQFTLYLLVTVKFGQCYAYWVGNDCVASLTNKIYRFHFIFQLRPTSTSIFTQHFDFFPPFCTLANLRYDHTSHVQNVTQASRYEQYPSHIFF